MNLKEYFESLGFDLDNPPPFEPFVCHDKERDIIQVYLSDETSVTEWVNQYVAIYWDSEKKKVIGFEIACPTKIIKEGHITFGNK